MRPWWAGSCSTGGPTSAATTAGCAAPSLASARAAAYPRMERDNKSSLTSAAHCRIPGCLLLLRPLGASLAGSCRCRRASGPGPRAASVRWWLSPSRPLTGARTVNHRYFVVRGRDRAGSAPRRCRRARQTPPGLLAMPWGLPDATSHVTRRDWQIPWRSATVQPNSEFPAPATAPVRPSLRRRPGRPCVRVRVTVTGTQAGDCATATSTLQL